MNIRYKTLSNRTSQDIRFDQILRSNPLSSSPTSFSTSIVSNPVSQSSSRKRVNVVSFTPGNEGQELITRSDKSHDSSTETIIPDLCLYTSVESTDTNFSTVTCTANSVNALSFEHQSPLKDFQSSQFLTNPNNQKVNLTEKTAVESSKSNLTSRLPSDTFQTDINTSYACNNTNKNSVFSCENNNKMQSVNVPLRNHTFTNKNARNDEDQVNFRLPSASQADSTSSGTQKPAMRSIFSGKNKKAAYNPRSWQKDIEIDDSSPNKLLKKTSEDCTSRITPKLYGSQDLTTLSKLTQSTHFNSCSTKTESRNSQLAKPKSSTVTDNFAFPDSDEDVDMVSVTTQANIASNKLTNKQNNDSGSDDDVKPWFRSASRDKKSTGQLETSKRTETNRVSRSDKPLYTILRKVKEAHVCQERGETQHLLDDVNYLVDGLSDHNQINTRTLSILTLANKCLKASFRYTINAHGVFKRICEKLHDAYTDYALALPSAMLLLILSRDKDPNILDTESLSMMLKLFAAPDAVTVPGTASKSNKETERIRSRVRQLLDALQQRQNSRALSKNSDTCKKFDASDNNNNSNGSANHVLIGTKRVEFGAPSSNLMLSRSAALNMRHLQMNRQLTTKDLVIEAILNLGTRKAGDWFKAELRIGGGLDRVANSTADAVEYLADLDPTSSTSRRFKSVWRSCSNSTGLDTFALDRLKRVCHYTKLLENMTYMNSENQTYLVRYQDELLIKGLLRCLRVCISHIPACSDKKAALPSTNEDGVEVQDSTSTNSGHDILTDCVLGIFRFLVNVSHNGIIFQQLTFNKAEHGPAYSVGSWDRTHSGAGYKFNDLLSTCAAPVFKPEVSNSIFERYAFQHCVIIIGKELDSKLEFASDRLGRSSGLLEVTLDCLLKLPNRFPGAKRFDLLVLALCLLVNLCEHCPENRTRIVHLEMPKPNELIDDAEDDGESCDRRNNECLTYAIDEIIQLFLMREEKARNHDFERDDEDAHEAAARRRKEQEENDSHMANGKFGAPGEVGATVEEAGLKWRLIEDRKAVGFRSTNFIARNNEKQLKKRRRKRLQRKRRQFLAKLSQHKSDDDDDDELDDDEEEGDDDDDELDDDDDDEEMEEDDDEEDEFNDDDSVGSGADVEFVADTLEEQRKLAERMSQAQQHMEDSVVAAYAALLLGCILQSSPRYTDRIRAKLPEGQFRPLAIMLAKLLSFLSLAKGVGSSSSESILRIVRILEAQDAKADAVNAAPPKSNGH